MSKIFEDKSSILHHNLIFLWCIFINLIGFILFIISDKKSLSGLVFLLLLVVVSFIYFSRKTSKIVFFEKYCVIYSAPFFKHKYFLNDIKIIVKSNKIISIKIAKTIISYYSVLLKNEVRAEFIKYVEGRNDINSKFF